MLGHIVSKHRNMQRVVIRRALLGTLFCIWSAFGSIAVLLSAPGCAFAYVDPSVMTYTIQAFAGVAVALGAVLGVMWRRVRRKVLELLNVDEDHGKQREGMVHRTGAQDGVAGAETHHAVSAADCVREGTDPATSRPGGADPHPSPKRTRGRVRGSVVSQNLSYPKRFAFALVAMAFLMYTYFVASPFEIIGGNTASLSFALRDIWIVMLAFALVVGVIAAALIALLRGRAYQIALGVAFALAIAGFLQSLFMNEGLPSADGSVVPWESFAGTMVVNAVVWVAIIVVCVVLIVRFPALGRACMVVLACTCMVAQTIGIARYALVGILEEYTVPTPTEAGLFEVASDNNVIVFVVDTVDTQVLDNTLNEFPDALADFTGFTYFHNSTGGMNPTIYAMPYLLTGERIETGEDCRSYTTRRYTSSTFIDDISAQGYSIGLYADCIFDGRKIFADKTMNLRVLGEKQINALGTLAMLSQVSFYRDAPWLLKPLFWYYTGDIDQAVLEDGEEKADEETPYVIDDVGYYARLNAEGLSVHDEEGAKGAFRLIHLNGAHAPYTYDENVNVSEEGTTIERQTRGTLTILQKYFSELKRLGLYDSSTIFVMADHGCWNWCSVDADLGEPSSPLCLVKPATESGGSAAPCVVSNVPVSQDDFHPTVIDAVGGDKSDYGLGYTYFEMPDASRVRIYDAIKDDGGSYQEIWRYEITGDALDFSSWRFTGEKWEAYGVR